MLVIFKKHATSENVIRFQKMGGGGKNKKHTTIFITITLGTFLVKIFIIFIIFSINTQVTFKAAQSRSIIKKKIKKLKPTNLIFQERPHISRSGVHKPLVVSCICINRANSRTCNSDGNQIQELQVSSTLLLQNKSPHYTNIKVLFTTECSLEQFSTFQIATLFFFLNQR